MAKGRPQDPEQQEKVKMALLNAVRELLCSKTYKSISIREVAEKAGTYSAMISYYFENKEGLVKALIVRTASERKIKLAAIGKEVAAQPDQSISILVNRVVSLLQQEPWLFRLFQDELMTTNHAFRAFFMENFAQVVVAGLRGMFTSLQQQGIVREDLNLTFLVPTFMSLVSFPILASPILEEGIGLPSDMIGSPEWQAYISEFLIANLCK